MQLNLRNRLLLAFGAVLSVTLVTGFVIYKNTEEKEGEEKQKNEA